MSTQDHIDKATSLFMKLLNENKNADNSEIELAAAAAITKVTQQIKESNREEAQVPQKPLCMRPEALPVPQQEPKVELQVI